MFCKLNSYCLNGVDAIPIDVEIDLHDGLPGFDIVGLPDCAVKEAKERVKSAIKNSGYKFPICHITVNLAPADIKKEGSLYDLPIALGILACLGELPIEALETTYFIGELALDGTLRAVKGLLPLLCAIPSSCQCIIPINNESEGTLINTTSIYLAAHLHEVIDFMKSATSLKQCGYQLPLLSNSVNPELTFDCIKGQEQAKRGLLICAAGHHNALLIGPPGSGKTMLSKSLPSIMPPLTDEEAIEVTKIYSVAKQLPNNEIIRTRPFRSPHHTISPLGLTGGGTHPKPGEMSLAHLGILFLDELLEFNRHTLELLRQPLEAHQITIARAQQSLTYPAQFLFVASTNPCPCGYYPDAQKCSCSVPSIKKYLAKLSGPLIDRIDVHLETHVPSLKELQAPSHYSAKSLTDLTYKVHKLQAQRYKDCSFYYNSEIPTALIPTFCPLTPEAENLLHHWFEQTGSSVRAYDKILRLARTIADLEDALIIEETHLAEALQYRLLDRQFWA